MFKNNVLVIIEIDEPNKASDVRYITIGCSEINKTDTEFEKEAIAAFKSAKNYPANTKFICKHVIKFNDVDEYLKFFKNQLADYLAMDK